MKRRPKFWTKIVLGIVCLLIIFIVIYIINIGKVNNDNAKISFEVSEGSTFTSLAGNLKESNLIKSELFYKIYVKLNNPKGLQAGTYQLSRNMNVSKIIDVLGSGTTNSDDYINITFKEGINMRGIIEVITQNTSINEEQIIAKLNDNDYLNSIIEKYWFITDDIKNNNIYYSLEGYLYPDTYQVHKNGKIEDVFKSMLDNMELKLKSYKKSIQNNKYSIHELITLASIVELEAANSNDRNGVAGVFYNRLESNWSLGSDVTTYYGAKIDMSERDLYQKEINEYNSYNTRNSKMAGKLPVGPICIPSVESIEAVINPTKHNYYYFVADKNKKTYFNTSDSGHINTVSKLKRDGLWYEY